MARQDTIDGRLKQIRKELELIDGDLKSLSRAATNPASGGLPKIKSKQLKDRSVQPAEKRAREPVTTFAVGRQDAQRVKHQDRTEPQPGTKGGRKNDERFLEYLSSSFDRGRPLGKERRIQRNKAVLMLVIVLFLLFMILYGMLL